MMDIRQFLKENTRIPVIGAPLFTVSYPELVIAQCKAGIVGSFPALNARPADQLEVWIEKISKEFVTVQMIGWNMIWKFVSNIKYQ